MSNLTNSIKELYEDISAEEVKLATDSLISFFKILEQNESFFANEFDWHSIINKSKQFFCYHGSNDPYVLRSNFNFIANNLQARKIIISQGGI